MEKTFAKTEWCDEDIENALETLDFDVSEENVNKVRNEIDEEEMLECMCETGFNYIYNKIWRIKKQLKKGVEDSD